MNSPKEEQLQIEETRLRREKERLETYLKKSERFLQEADQSTKCGENVLNSVRDLFSQSDDRRFFDGQHERLRHEGQAYLTSLHDGTQATRKKMNTVSKELEFVLKEKKKAVEEAPDEH